MRKILFLALIVSGALLLVIVPSRDALGSPGRATQEPPNQPAPPVTPVVPVPPVPQIRIHVEPPHIEPPHIDVHVDPEEIARNVREHLNITHEDFEPIDVNFDHGDRDLNVRADEKIEKSFAMPAGHRTLEIDNVWGSIEVVGTTSDQVQLAINKSIRAESQAKIEEARKEVILDITEEQGLLKLYVNGPFRCHCDEGCGHREFEGYIVKMDFQIQVPRDIDIKIKTVNEGRVSVRDINGSFIVRNVNGDIQMHNVAGSGTARTVNGPVKVSFRQNPREASDFQTVNGNVELRFTQGLAADFRFKTFNGSIYSDFPVSVLPVRAIQEEHHGAKVVFHADRYTGVRINSGGPEIKVENLNGDIRILENHE
jgi:hypothetical protein